MTSYALRGSVVEDEDESARIAPLTVPVLDEKKRFRSVTKSPIPPGMQTPTLILPRSPKRRKVDYDAVTPPMLNDSDLWKMVPDDVVGHVLSFLGSLHDRFALQCTSRQFNRLSNSDEILVSMKLGGNSDTNVGGIFRDNDTVNSAVSKVSIFARAGNLEALYMLGMIKTYCQPDVEGGILILKRAAADGFVRAHYTLGLILRDSHPDEAALHMQLAAASNYLPALQEVLPNRDMKAKFGELSAPQLRPYLDPVCLNRLLGRHYLNSPLLRELNTSHCWNPICGRWAFKAQMVPPSLTEASFHMNLRVSRMKMCSRCCRAKYCSKLCQVYDWRSGRHKTECQYL